MADITFSSFDLLVKDRRTVKVAAMNGAIIPNQEIQNVLELANWAPTHGKTEPWFFFVFTGDALKNFGKTHAELYWKNTSEENRKTTTYENLEHAVDNASHLIIAVMKRGDNPKIPLLEEIAATSASIQNILLGATALGIAAFWNTGGMTHHKAMKEYLNLSEHDLVMGLLYLGYTDEPKKVGIRNIPMSEKIKWM